MDLDTVIIPPPLGPSLKIAHRTSRQLTSMGHTSHEAFSSHVLSPGLMGHESYEGCALLVQRTFARPNGPESYDVCDSGADNFVSNCR